MKIIYNNKNLSFEKICRELFNIIIINLMIYLIDLINFSIFKVSFLMMNLENLNIVDKQID
jgi:hypothetical protein